MKSYKFLKLAPLAYLTGFGLSYVAHGLSYVARSESAEEDFRNNAHEMSQEVIKKENFLEMHEAPDGTTEWDSSLREIFNKEENSPKTKLQEINIPKVK